MNDQWYEPPQTRENDPGLTLSPDDIDARLTFARVALYATSGILALSCVAVVIWGVFG